MSKIINIHPMTFPCAPSSGIVARRVVVMDTSVRGNVKLPAGTPEKTFAGITTENASAANNVALQRLGVAAVESDGSAVINPGDQLIAVGTTGRVKTQAIAAGSANLYQVIGTCVDNAQIPATAGAIVSVELGPYMVSAA